MTWAIATPVPHNNIRRWLGDVAQFVTHAFRRAPRQPKQGPPHALREAFIEDAAMAREMLRL